MEITTAFRPGQFQRPEPLIHHDEVHRFLIVLTSWGPRGGSKLVVDRLCEHLIHFQADQDVTVPYPSLEALSRTANNLRAAALMVNELVLKMENATEWTASYELAIVDYSAQEWTWLQVGQPHLLLHRASTGFVPLALAPELHIELAAPASVFPALPLELLGVDKNLRPRAGSLRRTEGDTLFLVQHQDPRPLLRTPVPEEPGLLTEQWPAQDPIWLSRITDSST